MVLIVGWPNISSFEVGWSKSKSDDSLIVKNRFFPFSYYPTLQFYLIHYANVYKSQGYYYM
jgi:hypothetical protein